VTGAADSSLGADSRQRLAADHDAISALFVELHDLPPDSERRRAVRDQLIEAHQALVEYLARRFSGRGEQLDDLVQVGMLGLIKAVDRFDIERGVEFSTYATPTVVGEIKRHFRDKGWAVRVPRRLQELRAALTVARADLTQELGQAPTVRQLAERLNIDEDEALEGLESANAYSAISLDTPPSDQTLSVADTLGSEDEGMLAVEYRESLKPLMDGLAEREKRLLLLRFFKNKTQSQIADELGISQMHVSRLLARTLAELREQLLTED